MAVEAPPSLREWVREHDEKWLFVVLYLGLAVGLSVLVSLFWLVVVGVLHFILELFRQAHYRDGARSVTLHALWEVKLDIALILLALMLVLYIEVVLGLLGIQSAARAAAVSRAGARVGTRAAAWERNLRTFLLTVDEMVRVVYAGVMLRKKRARDGGMVDAQASSVKQNMDSVSVEDSSGGGGVSGVSDLEGAEEAGGSGGGADPTESPDRPETIDGAEPTGEPETTSEPATPGDEREVAPTEGKPGDPGVPARSGPLPPIWRTRWKVVDHIGVVLVVLGVVLIVAAPWLTPHDWGSAGAALLEELRPFPGSSSHEG